MTRPEWGSAPNDQSGLPALAPTKCVKVHVVDLVNDDDDDDDNDDDDDDDDERPAKRKRTEAGSYAQSSCLPLASGPLGFMLGVCRGLYKVLIALASKDKSTYHC